MKKISRRHVVLIDRTLRCSIAALCVIYLASCGGSGDGSTGPGPETQAVASVTVTPGTLPLLLGESGQLTPTMRDAAGTVLAGRPVTWATTNQNVATVAAGVVTATGVGTATITATSEGKTGSAEVSVTAVPLPVPLLTFASFVTGGAHTCALTAIGAAYCWGRGESGQLGVPPPTSTCSFDSSSSPCSLTRRTVEGGVVFALLTAGGAHTCGLTSDGSAYCWGSNTSGQLGDNSTIARNAPVLVATALKFASIDAGLDHTCGLTSDGSAYCWGRNDRGQLGDGTSSPRSVPTKVAGELSFQLVTGGGFFYGHTCALTAAGDAYCWGDNERGQLGNGSADVVAHPLPAPVIGGLKLVVLSAGLGRHTCGRTATGAAYCWGENSFGGLGNGSTTDSPTPVPVSGGIAFTQLVAGGFIGHTCGLASSGVAYCWGENEVGATGDGTTTDRLTPTAVAGGFVWTSIDAGFRHTCARANTGTVYCWGSGRAGQLGTNSTGASNVPVKVVGQP